MSVHNKLEAAKNQLDRAIKLFFAEADYYSAVTLAGAAEEILGKMLEAQGEKHALASLSSAIADIFTANDLPTLRNRELVRQLNDVRDWLKHYTDGKDLDFDAKEAAAALIDRAVTNYYQLTGRKTGEMTRFTGQQE
jgi:hypothetical protein